MENIKREIERLRDKRLMMPRMYSWTEVKEIVEFIDEENKKETDAYFNAYVLQEIRKGNYKVEKLKQVEEELKKTNECNCWETYECENCKKIKQETEREKEEVSLCENCFCVTKTIKGKCGKCKGEKDDRKS